MTKVAVIGAGSWGTTVANVSASIEFCTCVVAVETVAHPPMMSLVLLVDVLIAPLVGSRNTP